MGRGKGRVAGVLGVVLSHVAVLPNVALCSGCSLIVDADADSIPEQPYDPAAAGASEDAGAEAPAEGPEARPQPGEDEE